MSTSPFDEKALSIIYDFFEPKNDLKDINSLNLVSKAWKKAEDNFWQSIFKKKKIPPPNYENCLFTLKEIYSTIICDKALVLKYQKNYKNLWTTKFDKSDWTNDQTEWKLISLNELIRNLFISELDLMETFLFTFPSFTNDYMVLLKVFEFYNPPKDVDVNRKQLQLFVVSLIKKWVHLKLFPYHLSKKLDKFAEVTTDKNFLKFFQDTMTQKLKRHENNFLFPTFNVPSKKNYQKLIQDISDIDLKDFTEQFTLRSFDSYKLIKREDILRFTTGGNTLSYVFKMSEESDIIGTWICSEILKESKLAMRQKKLKFFIEAAFAFYKMKNYSNAFSFYQGVSNSYITNLPSTFLLDKKLTQILIDLENVFDPDFRFHKYKQHLNATDPPCIPYLGIVTDDLITNLEGSVNTDYLIDWNMKRDECLIVKKYLFYQEDEYDYQRIPMIQAFISKSLYDENLLTDKQMFKLGKEVKASEGSQRRKSNSSLKEMLNFSYSSKMK
eukprot:gene5281-8899_t